MCVTLMLAEARCEFTCSELVRYRQFLGIQNEAKNIAQSRGASNPADKYARAFKPVYCQEQCLC